MFFVDAQQKEGILTTHINLCDHVNKCLNDHWRDAVVALTLCRDEKTAKMLIGSAMKEVIVSADVHYGILE